MTRHGKGGGGYPNEEGQEFGGLEKRLRKVLSELVASTEDHSDDRKTVVRWFNRLVYEIGAWNEALLLLLDEYDSRRSDSSENYLEEIESRFYSFAKVIDQRNYWRIHLMDIADDPTAFDICGRITFLQKRFQHDFEWMKVKDPQKYRMLLVAINDTVDAPGFSHGPRSELSRELNVLEDGIFGRYDYETRTRAAVNPNEVKMAIEEYRNWSSGLLDQLSHQARVIGVSLLSIHEYEDALLNKGSSDPRLYVIGEVTMSNDTYNVGQAGAVGPGATAKQFTMQQIWKQNASRFDLEELAEELSTLRSELRIHAIEAEHDMAIGAVAAAETAAAKGDGPVTLEKLKEAGKWTLDVATKIGVTVASAALKVALKI